MSVLLWEAVDEHNRSRGSNSKVGVIDYEQGFGCVGIQPSGDENNHISVVLKNAECGEEKTVNGKLIVGADGIKSTVRRCLLEEGGNKGVFSAWGYNPKKFQVKSWISPASGLRLKVSDHSQLYLLLNIVRFWHNLSN